MQLKNTHEKFGWIAIVLHWIAAIGVAWLYFLGENIEHAKEDGLAREEVRALIEYHVSIAMIFIVFLAARVLWHIAHKQPAKPRQHRALTMLAYAVQWGFLVMIAIQIITGPIIEWSVMRPLKVFDLFSVPSPFPAAVGWFHEGAETVHKLASNLFWPLIALHVGAALKHLVLDRDCSFQRMILVRGEKSGAEQAGR